MQNTQTITAIPTFTTRSGGRKFRAKALKRVSTDGQDVARQERELHRIAKRVDAEIVSTLELHGVSGKDTLTHAQVQQILRELESPDIDGLIVPAVDRLFRPQRLEDYQIGITFQNFRKYLWTETDDTIEMWTPEGRDAFIEAGKRAGAELRKIRQRSMSGKINAITDPERIAKLNGMTPLNSSAVPYGYRFIPRDRINDIPAHMVIDEAEAAIVRRCFSWAMLRITCHTIAGMLNSEGVRTKRFGKVDRKARNGADGKPAVSERINTGEWCEQTIYQMMTKQHYIGDYLAYAKTENETLCHCPAIVERDVWESVQLILADNAKNATGPSGSKREWLLTGLGRCKFCGHRLCAQSKGKRCYYACSFRSKPPVRSICTGPLPSIEKAALETTVFDAAWKAITEAATLVRIIATAYADAPGDPLAAQEAERIRELLAKLERNEKRAWDNLQDSDISREVSKPAYTAAKKAVEHEQFRLAQALAAAAPRKANRPPDAAILALAAKLTATVPQTYADRHAWLHGIVTEFCTDGATVEIECAIPQDSFNEAVIELETAAADTGGGLIIPKGCKYSASELFTPLTAPIVFRINATI